MSETTEIEIFEAHAHPDNAAWVAGYDYGVWLAVATDLSEPDEPADLETQTVAWAAKHQCMVCGATDAMEFPPRLPGRDPVWLCRHDLARFISVASPWPGDEPDRENPRNADEPMWAAGLLTAVATFGPMTGRKLTAGDDDAARTFWRNMARRVKREMCSVCPGVIHTWEGGSSIGGVSVCSRCREHLRERLALLEWTASAPGGER